MKSKMVVETDGTNITTTMELVIDMPHEFWDMMSVHGISEFDSTEVDVLLGEIRMQVSMLHNK